MIEIIDDPLGYQAGVCNIGPAEIRRRRMAGIAGVAAAILLGGLLLLLDVAPAWRLLVALPLASGLSGFLQARWHFCANYGWRGLRNLGAIGDAERVADARARAVDRRRALTIFGLSAAGAIAVAVAFMLLPA